MNAENMSIIFLLSLCDREEEMNCLSLVDSLSLAHDHPIAIWQRFSLKKNNANCAYLFFICNI